MDILDEVKDEVKKEQIMHICKKYGKYLIFVFLLIFILYIFFFCWQDFQENQILKEANDYNRALSMNETNMNNNLEKLKTGKTIYASLAQLQLAVIYVDKKDFNKAIHNYEQLIKKKSINNLYLDYVKLMLIKVKLVSGKINNEVAIKLFQEYLNNSLYFHNLARLGESVLFVNKGEQDKAVFELDFIITDHEAPKELVNLAKIIKKRVN